MTICISIDCDGAAVKPGALFECTADPSVSIGDLTDNTFGAEKRGFKIVVKRSVEYGLSEGATVKVDVTGGKTGEYSCVVSLKSLSLKDSAMTCIDALSDAGFDGSVLCEFDAECSCGSHCCHGPVVVSCETECVYGDDEMAFGVVVMVGVVVCVDGEV